MVFTEKSKFSFYFIVYMPMRASDAINNVTKQNMNVMASTLSASHVKRWRDKKKKKKKKNRQIEIILIPKCSLHSN